MMEHAPLAADDSLRFARQALADMAAALSRVGDRLDSRFVHLLRRVLRCSGSVHVSGIGKSFVVAQKIACTLASTGTPATALHATEGLHGDVGRVRAGDVVLLLSHSGQTEEVLKLARAARDLGAWVAAFTQQDTSPLAQAAELTVAYGPLEEAGPLRLVPTTSALAMVALGDALALACFSARGRCRSTYAARHPGGALGRQLEPVLARMRQGAAVPIVAERASVAEVLAVMTETPGRPGAACVVDDDGRLVGLFTDGDLRRRALVGPLPLEEPIGASMYGQPRRVAPETSVAEAAALLVRHGLDQLPVVDDAGRPVGLLDIQDVL